MKTIFLLFSLALSTVFALRTVVLTGEKAVSESHSKFIELLKANSEVTVKSIDEIKEKNFPLQKYGEYLYDALVLLCPAAEDLPIDEKHVTAFVDSGRSLIFIANEKLTETHRTIAEEFGVKFDDEEMLVADFAAKNHEGDDEHNLLANQWLAKYQAFFDEDPAKKASVKWRGVAHGADNALVVPLLRGSLTAFSSSEDKKGELAGRDVLLISALQARSNARVLFSGSMDFFADNSFATNEWALTSLVQWVFGLRGKIMAEAPTHSLIRHNDDPESLNRAVKNASVYRLADYVSYEIKLKQWDQKAGAWVPFNVDDVQMELHMLDPYFRYTIPRVADGLYRKDFQLPDVYGVFQFRLTYERPGYSYIHVMDQVSVRPFRHDEHPRFLPVATPYYVSCGLMIAFFVVFSIVFLYNKPTPKPTATASRQKLSI